MKNGYCMHTLSVLGTMLTRWPAANIAALRMLLLSPATVVTERVRCLPISIVRRYGHTPEERLLNWLGVKVKEALGSHDATFAQVGPLQTAL